MSDKTTATKNNRLSEDEVDDRLRGRALCRLATMHQDGSIYITPLWFTWDEQDRVFWLTLENTKRRHVQNLRQDNRISIVVDEDPRVAEGLDKGAWAISVRGTGEVIQDWDVIPGVLRRILTGAIGADGAEAYLKELAHDDRVVVRITPEKWLTWDYNKASA
jgi:general stress protein 26